MCGSICPRGGAPVGSRTVPTFVENELFVFRFWGYVCACVLLFLFVSVSVIMFPFVFAFVNVFVFVFVSVFVFVFTFFYCLRFCLYICNCVRFCLWKMRSSNQLSLSSTIC